jgi:hypothetical protein
MGGRSVKAPSTVPRRLINRVMHKSNLAEQKCTPVAKEGDNEKKGRRKVSARTPCSEHKCIRALSLKCLG